MRLKKTSDKYECKKCESLFVFQGVAGSFAGTICFVQQGPNCLLLTRSPGREITFYISYIYVYQMFSCLMDEIFLKEILFIAHPPSPSRRVFWSVRKFTHWGACSMHLHASGSSAGTVCFVEQGPTARGHPYTCYLSLAKIYDYQ